jgi:uncharacterized protein Yka (UPF0111/DUF47 family)
MNKLESEIISFLVDHSRILYSALSDMGVYYTTWKEGSLSEKSVRKALDKKRSKLQLSEEDADGIKIKVIKDYSERGAPGLSNYMTLILRMDNVINSALEFVDIISSIHSKEQVNKEMLKRYDKLINTLMKMGDELKTTIKNLRDAPQEVFNNTTMIHELENEIDQIFRDFLNYLYDMEGLEIRLLFKLRDSIKILEELADRIHDIADLIRVLVYQ